MKKTFFLPVFVTLLMAGISQAVTVHWAVATLPNTFPVGYSITSASLVYTTAGLPEYTLDGASYMLSWGERIGDVVSGLAITPEGIGERTSDDLTTRSSGDYYVVLFAIDTVGSGQTYYATSTTGLVWNSTTSITSDPLAPATQSYDPSAVGGGGFSSFTPVPEPSSAALLFAGLAAVMMRRRRRAA